MIIDKKVIKKSHAPLPKIVADNIAHLVARHKEKQSERGYFHVVADKVTNWFGSTTFLAAHVVLFIFWIMANFDYFPSLKKFDPYPFQFLTFVVSIEAILLSVLVLMVQNKIQKDADRRAELDLHINLLTESETTMLLRKISRIETKLGIEIDREEDEFVAELLVRTDPVDIEETIDSIT